MNVSKMENVTNFKGRVILGAYLSQNFLKTLPELNLMLKDKPYNVFVKAGNIHKKRGHIKRTTFFNATNSNHLKMCKTGLLEAHSSTNKSRKNSYIYALNNVINDMDLQIEKHQVEKPKKEDFKEKIFNIIHNLFL